MRASLIVVCLLALAASMAAEEEWSARPEPDHADHRHRVVRIFETRVHPRTIEVHPSDALSWLNYSSRRAQVSFDREVAKHLTCKTRGTFRLDGDRLRSVDIQATQFASLCSLAPGEYTYRVELASGLGGSGAPRARSGFDGKIVVAE